MFVDMIIFLLDLLLGLSKAIVDSDVANAECKAMRYVPLSVALNRTREAAQDSCNFCISARPGMKTRIAPSRRA